MIKGYTYYYRLHKVRLSKLRAPWVYSLRRGKKQDKTRVEISKKTRDLIKSTRSKNYQTKFQQETNVLIENKEPYLPY